LSHALIHAHIREQLAMFAEHPVPFSILCMEIDNLEKIWARGDRIRSPSDWPDAGE
jgi:hypothetical protein